MHTRDFTTAVSYKSLTRCFRIREGPQRWSFSYLTVSNQLRAVFWKPHSDSPKEKPSPRIQVRCSATYSALSCLEGDRIPLDMSFCRIKGRSHTMEGICTCLPSQSPAARENRVCTDFAPAYLCYFGNNEYPVHAASCKASFHHSSLSESSLSTYYLPGTACNHGRRALHSIQGGR